MKRSVLRNIHLKVWKNTYHEAQTHISLYQHACILQKKLRRNILTFIYRPVWKIAWFDPTIEIVILR